MTVMDLPKVAPPRPKRWTATEFQTLVEQGAFRKQHVFLLRGELIEMPPMGALHARSLSRLTAWLVQTFEPLFEVRIQSPFQCANDSLPEPDGAVYTLTQAQRLPHPEGAVLLAEISDSSLKLDFEKAFDYDAAGVAEYWLLDVVGRKIEVFRDPVNDASTHPGFRYQHHTTFGEADTIASLARPDQPVAVRKLLALP